MCNHPGPEKLREPSNFSRYPPNDQKGRKDRSGAHRGVTFIELLIVMAVIGILATLVYPSYTESIRNARRSDATTDLMAWRRPRP